MNMITARTFKGASTYVILSSGQELLAQPDETPIETVRRHKVELQAKIKEMQRRVYQLAQAEADLC